jgi:SAM-dependent methyltransferase
MNRRKFALSISAFIGAAALFPLKVTGKILSSDSNFRYVYLQKNLRDRFYLFLQNVFNLYPEDKMHELISGASKNNPTDKDIYLASQEGLSEITPFFSIFKYQLPALFKQKDEMARQTLELLGEGSQYNGYLEIGSSGRYLDYLEEKVDIEGQRYYADVKEPGHSITEMVDRGQIAIGADFIPMANYQTDFASHIKKESLDLVTVYIGFHHCPLHLRTQYISSVGTTLRPGGKLVLRDHDCDSEDQKRIVALAHDVFNMGTKETWKYNQAEIRNFYTLDFIINFVEDLGFRFEKQTLFQEGDPTKNALMLFTKV